MSEEKFIPLKDFKKFSEKEMLQRSSEYLKLMKKRRTIRYFSDKKVERKVIENCILTAGSAPSGANLQPWPFVVVSEPEIKKTIRKEAEKEEKKFYNNRATEEWLKALKPLGTDEHKPYLETAPYLIAIFEKKYSVDKNGEKIKHYYSNESTGIATGFLISAIHNAGLASLTHTPSPMSFLNKILNRPKNERPFLLLVVGYPAEDAKVPDITKKELNEIAEFV